MKQIRVSRSCATRCSVQRVEVAEIDTLARRASRGIHHQRLVLGPDRPDGDGRAVLRAVQARRTASDTAGSPAAAVSVVDFRPCRITRASRATGRSGEASSGLMSISLIQRLLDDQLAEADQELLQRRQVDRLRPRTPLSAV